MEQRSSVADFGEQWTSYTQQEGYFASEEMLQDYFGPLLKLEVFSGKSVCEVGSGNGRFVKLIANHAQSVCGIEPSDAVAVAREYTSGCPNVKFINESIYDVEPTEQFDYVLCLGVLHHLPHPVDAVRKIHSLTKSGGRAVIWVYGKEGNRTYLIISGILRFCTTRIPHKALDVLSKALTYPLKWYIALCKKVPLPMRSYMLNVLGKYDDYTLTLTIYDQLNPSIAEYWSRSEFESILRAGGFADCKLYHRHGYSWTAIMEKP